MADKVTMAEFEKRLSSGAYESLTGARRGIGKMAGWTEKERNAAREKAEAHFAGKGGKAAPKKAQKAPKAVKAKAVAAKAPTPKVAKEKKSRAPRAKAEGHPQLELPIDDTIARVHASKAKSEAVSSILNNIDRLRGLGGPDAELKKAVAALTKDLTESVKQLLGTSELILSAPSAPAGDNGKAKVDTSAADAALAAAAATAQNAVKTTPPIIPPMMGRQG
jgi:hypothetical protein